MEKPDRDSQGSELNFPPDVKIAEEMVEEEPQKQEDPESQMQDNQVTGELREETRMETSLGLTGMAHKAVAGECQKQGTIQVTTQIADDAATKEVPEPSENIEFRIPIGKIVEEVMSFVPAEHAESSKLAQKTVGIEGKEKIPEPTEEQQNVPGVEREVRRNLERGEQPGQELQVQQIEQAMELVLEEVVICHGGQERMEEAENIEEPQKYAFREKDND